MPKKEKPYPYHLIETISGKTIALADDPESFKEVIDKKVAYRYTLHHAKECWFSPATSLFKDENDD